MHKRNVKGTVNIRYKKFFLDQLKWLATYICLSFIISLILPFPISLSAMAIGLPPEVLNAQNIVGKHWEDKPTWSGACVVLAKLDKPMLIITGTDDNLYQPHVNSLKIAEKIPGAWLVQIKNVGHAVVNQYPACQ